MNVEGCDMSYSMFEKLDLSGSYFINNKIHEVDFRQCNLNKVVFKGSNLTRTRFDRSDLSESDFRKAKNYFFDPGQVKCKKARFDSPEVLNLLKAFNVIIE